MLPTCRARRSAPRPPCPGSDGGLLPGPGGVRPAHHTSRPDGLRAGGTGEEPTMDKSPRNSTAKKSGKSLKEKRAIKKGKAATSSAASAASDAVHKR